MFFSWGDFASSQRHKSPSNVSEVRYWCFSKNRISHMVLDRTKKNMIIPVFLAKGAKLVDVPDSFGIEKVYSICKWT